MQFIEVGGVTLNMDLIESVDKRSSTVVHVVSGSGQAYTFEGADADALRSHFTQPPAAAPAPAHAQPASFDFNPTGGPVLEKTYPCGCHVTGSKDLPDYCAEHGRPEEQKALTS